MSTEEKQVMQIQGINLPVISEIDSNRLSYFQAPNAEENASTIKAIALANSLVSIPRYAGLMAFVLPGNFPAGKLTEDAVELSLLLREGLGANDETFVHFLFPNGTGEIMNVGLLLKAFAGGWQAGIEMINIESYRDGVNPRLALTTIPAVTAVIDQVAVTLFGQFSSAPPAIDPFAPPTGLPSPEAKGLNQLGDGASDPHEL